MYKSRESVSDNVFKAALYVRLSNDDGDKVESNSVTTQKSMLLNYIEKNNDIDVFNIYVDDGYTGTNFDRPSFKNMINDIENNLVNCVIVKDLSRFGRDYIETGRYLEKFFPQYNVRFVAVNENIDSHKSQYDMLMPIRNIFNEQYSRDISKKVQSAFKTKQLQGNFVGAFPSYGYKKDSINKHKLAIDVYAASIIKRIFSLYNSGNGKVKIAKILNNDGVLCPTEYKNKNGDNYCNSNKNETTSYWTYSTIAKILKNEMYIGNMVQGKTKRKMKGIPTSVPKSEWIVVEDTHPAIIDNDTWETTQNLLKRNVKNLDFNTNVSIFAGFLKCGDCGRALSKTKWSGSETYYSCSSYKRYGIKICSSHIIHHSDLETIILNDLNCMIKSAKDIRRMINEQKDNETNSNNDEYFKKEIKMAEMQLEKIKKTKKNIYVDYTEGILTKEEYLSYKNDYSEEESLHEQKIKTLSESAEKDNRLEEKEWITKLANKEEIKHLDRDTIVSIINMIYIYENKEIKIVYNFADEIDCFVNQFATT